MFQEPATRKHISVDGVTYLSLLPGLRLFLETLPAPSLVTTGAFGPSLSRADFLLEEEDLLRDEVCLLSEDDLRCGDLPRRELLDLCGEL